MGQAQAPPASSAASAPAAKTPADQAPPATASAYVFSPQQAVSARPGTVAPQRAPQAAAKAAAVPAAPAPPESAPHAVNPAPSPAEPQAPVRGELQLEVIASSPTIATGAVVTVDVLASSNAAVVDAPLHLSFDPRVVEYVDGAPGDFLTQGGSSLVFFADGSSRPGDVAVALGRVDRGQGAMGSGLLCRVRFRGVAAGTTAIAVGQAKAWGTRGEEFGIQTTGTNVVIR
jgi:hypothetical protein